MIGTLYLIIAAGLLAILYGYVVGKQILLASPGTTKMQEIASKPAAIIRLRVLIIYLN